MPRGKRRAGPLDAAINRLCRRWIVAAVRETGTYAGAARLLGMPRPRFYRICARCWPSAEDRMAALSRKPAEPGATPQPTATPPAPGSLLPSAEIAPVEPEMVSLLPSAEIEPVEPETIEDQRRRAINAEW